MECDDVLERFALLSTAGKILALSSLAHQLTICARASYPHQVSEEQVTKNLITFNELQHHVTSQLHRLLRHDEQRYADDVLISILFDKARLGNCESELQWAFEWALRRTAAA